MIEQYYPALLHHIGVFRELPLQLHPALPPTTHPLFLHTGVVRCEGYFSAWRCSPTSNPWGGPGPAVATLLLHRDELKVPEYLARTAIR